MKSVSSRLRKTKKILKRKLSTESTQRSIRSHDGTTSQMSSSASDEDYDELVDLGIAEFLEHDPRPTLIIHIDTDVHDVFEPVFSNLSFRSNHQLLRSVTQTPATDSFAHSFKTSTTNFKLWLKGVCALAPDPTVDLPTFFYGGHLWTAFKVLQHWTVISGNCETEDNDASLANLSLRADGTQQSPQHSPQQEARIVQTKSAPSVSQQLDVIPAPLAAYVTPGTPDWTVASPEGDLSPHLIFARSIDWASTPLGDMITWSKEFRQVANLIMQTPHPVAIFWGDELTVMYNKSYAEQVAGQKHPALMGTGFRGPFAELWDTVGETFADCVRDGRSVMMKEQMLPIDRHGYVEETYFTWSLTPLYGGTSRLLGLYNAPFETTRQTINDRRTKTLLKVGTEVALAQSISDFWARVLNALKENGTDFPFALLYSVSDELDQDDDSSISSDSSHVLKTCILEGALGVPDGHAAAPAKLDLKRARGGFIPAFRDAMKTREPKLLNIMDGTLPQNLIEGLMWRGFGEPCKLAIVCPIRPTTGENVLGFLVVGINPRRPYDQDYEAFIQLLNRQLATALASCTLFEEEIRRGHLAAELAAQERSRLSEELAVQRGRLQRIAEVSPVGMFSIDQAGLILEANDRWYEMTGHPRDTAYEMSWMEVIHESSMEVMKAGWKRLTEDKLPWSAELRLKKVWFDPTTGLENDNWVLSAAQPEFAMDGTVRTIMGSITDITLQKRSAKDAEQRARLSEQLLLRTQETEALQNQRLKEAEETRRQQNNFIDITSHGMLPFLISEQGWDMFMKCPGVSCFIVLSTFNLRSDPHRTRFAANYFPEMRNPLSAIVQCADAITTSMDEIFKASDATKTILDENILSLIKNSIDAAETIQLCAQHQKSIVDDILTISKLDSNLLVISPVPVRPVKILQQVLKMFVAECSFNNIILKTHIDSSVDELVRDNLIMLDPSRLLQVLINLLTNAIKFTKSENLRQIDVSLSASLTRPSEIESSKLRYFPTKNKLANMHPDAAVGEEWGKGEVIFLRFEVRDTGCGLSESEQQHLFTRFSQASPRTHIQYGGSGLGLFISRQLTELQGGEIGMASDAGLGSTFAFYLKGRKSITDVTEESLPNVSEFRTATGPIESGLASKLKQMKTSESVISTKELTSKQDYTQWHVLIVEDNLVNQRILAAQITKLGCTTHVANHGGEALELLKHTRHYQGNENIGIELSIVLMDLEMPVMDGLTCVRKIREMQATGLLLGHLPIIAVTANARGEQIVAAKNSGMDDVMAKPFRIKQLVVKIEALLDKMAQGDTTGASPTI